jgi:hypothetical protein
VCVCAHAHTFGCVCLCVSVRVQWLAVYVSTHRRRLTTVHVQVPVVTYMVMKFHEVPQMAREKQVYLFL